MTPAQPADRKSRGSYARLICLNCRRRKIRCVLPEDASIEASEYPRPPESSCQRCRQMGLECIVDKTNLGRPPAAKRMRNGMAKHETPLNLPDDSVDGESARGDHLAAPDNELGDYFYYSEQVEGDRSDGFYMDEVFESLTSPLGLLCALAGRDRTFASQHGAKLDVSGKDAQILQILRRKSHRESIDELLYWQKVFYPDIPSVSHLFDEIKGPEHGHRAVSPVYVLLLVLLSIASDQPSGKVQVLEEAKPLVEARLVHQFEVLLLSLPYHRYAVLAIELVREYRPLTPLVSASNSARTLRGHNLLVIANDIIRRMDKEQADDTSSVDGLLQRCRLDMANTETYWSFQCRAMAAIRKFEHPTASLRLLECRLEEQENVPPNIVLSLYGFLAAEIRWRSMVELYQNWKSLTTIKEIISRHACATKELRDRFSVALKSRQSAPSDKQELHNLRHIFEAETHIYEVSIVGQGLGLGIVASSGHEEECLDKSNWSESEWREASERIVDRMIKPSPDDTVQPPISTFLVDVGKTRISELQSSMTNFIKLSEMVDGNGMRFQGPTRSLCANLLFNCKDLAENHAFMFKNYKSVLRDVDTHDLLLQSCVKGLEALEAGAGDAGAVARGSLVALTAKLVSSLRRIILGWKDRAADAERASRNSVGLASAGSGEAAGGGGGSVSEGNSGSNGRVSTAATTTTTNTTSSSAAAALTAAATTAATTADEDGGDDDAAFTNATSVDQTLDTADADMIYVPSDDDLLADWSVWPQLDVEEFSRYLRDNLDDGGLY